MANYHIGNYKAGRRTVTWRLCLTTTALRLCALGNGGLRKCNGLGGAGGGGGNFI